MAEIYSFNARVVARLKYRIRISPEDQDAFLDYLDRVGLSGSPFFRMGKCQISISNRKLTEATKGADRVRYSVEKRFSRLFGVSMEAVP